MNNEQSYLIKDFEAGNLALTEKTPSKSKVLYEDTTRRGKNTKHFRLKNGNFMAVLYDHPVHKLDTKTGKYVDSRAEVNETDKAFETSMEHFKVCIPKNDGKDSFITVEKDGKEVSWRYIPNKTVRKKKTAAKLLNRQEHDPWDVVKHRSFMFEKIDDSTDIQYDITDDEIKESIVLDKYTGCNIFSFELKMSGVEAKLSEDKKTVFFAGENVSADTDFSDMKIPPAYMEDSNGAFNDDIHYEIRKNGEKVFLDLVIDSDWLSEPERAYPVVIDPRVQISRYDTNTMKVVELCSDGSAKSYSDSSSGRRVGVDHCGVIHRLYMGFKLPELIKGFKITKAALVMHQKDYATFDGNIYNYNVAPVTDPNGSSLDVDSFNWNNVQGLNIGPTIDTVEGIYRKTGEKIEVDVTKTVETWYNSENPYFENKCLVIKKQDETPVVCDCTCKETYIDVFAPAVSGERFNLYIEYGSADMYSDNQKYHTFENGRAGTGSINLFNGKLSFAHGDFTTEGVKLPVSISHLYRYDFIDKDENGNIISNKYGNGWRLSSEQTLEIVNKAGVVAVYTNAQGKRHYFSDEENSDGEITDDSGLGLTFKEECNCYCGIDSAYVLTDEKGNKMTFDASGRLRQLIDCHNVESRIGYTNGNLSSIVDGAFNYANLYYNSQNKLDRIVDKYGRKTYYAYNTSGDLVSITYPSSENAYSNEGIMKTEFVYDNTHRLTKVIDYSGIAYTIEYDSTGRVKKLSLSGSKCVSDNQVTVLSETVDSSVSFDYHSRSTAVIDDRTGVKTVYKFDDNGRMLSSYQDMTSAEDASKITEFTMAELSAFEPVPYSYPTNKFAKYCSLSVNLGDEKNLLQNSSFASVTGESTPSGWYMVGGGRVNNDSYLSGYKSCCFASGSPQLGKYLWQTVSVCDCQPEGNILVASAWAKATGNAVSNSPDSKASFRVVLKITYEAGDSEEVAANFETDYNDKWQYVAVPFVYDKNKYPSEVTVKLDYSYNTGTCYFMNPRLVSVNGIVTTNNCTVEDAIYGRMDVFGESKVIKTIIDKRDSVLTTTEYIDENSDVVKTNVTDRLGRTFSTNYKYDSEHNLIKMMDYRGLVVEYTYNDYGKELTRKTYYKDNPNAYMYSELTYKQDHFVQTESDPRYMLNGEKLKTTYQHDTTRNLLLKQTAVNGQEYNYSYDDNTDDLVSLSSATDSKTNENQFFYTRGYLTRAAHNGFNFGFGFDEFGRSKTVTVGDGAESTTLLSMNYQKDGANDITETVYATGEKNCVTTDIFGNPTVSTYTDKNGNVRTVSSATYNGVGRLKTMIDNERNVCYTYTYDDKGNIISVKETDAVTGAEIATNAFVYDSNERLTYKTYGAVGHTYRPVYEKCKSNDPKYNGVEYPDNETAGITLVGKYTDAVEKDGLRRTQSRSLTLAAGSQLLFEESYSYLSTLKDGKTIETDVVSSISSLVHGSNASRILNYTYDKAGNIETVRSGATLLSKYYYDGLNRLKREDNYSANKTYVWEYDVGGNILSKKEYALSADIVLGTCLDTKTYTYKTTGWRDRLDTYNGQSCVYDSMGNPTTYRGNSLTWTKVRRLASYGSNTFDYGANGIRYRKNNITYTLDGNKILRETDGNRTITYYYGGSGIIGFGFNGTDYYYRKNLQGDVEEIYTSAGTRVASYVYDAWGKVLWVNNYTEDNIGDLNPIRYRSYYYDTETQLYYLNSRYYDPETGRFINADTTSVLEDAMYDINGLNLYVYCDNNPVANRDDDGDASFWKKLAVAVAVVTVVAVVAAATAVTGGALCAAATVFLGAAKGALVGAAVGAATGAVTGAVQGAVEGYQENGWDGVLHGMAKGALKGAVEGAKDGLISGLLMGGLSTGATTIANRHGTLCFTAGTVVLTTLGKKAIETIQVGDTVPCVDHITGETAEKRVISTTVNKTNRLSELDIDGETIRCTETHPFQVKGKGWVNASDLMPGDLIYTKDWNTATVKSVRVIVLDTPVEVFNFEVEDCHTYFVGDTLVLVHNWCKGNWAEGGRGSSANNARHHYNKHGIEVGAKDVEEYTKKATNFANKVLNRKVKTAHVGGVTPNTKRYFFNQKYVDLSYNGSEHLLVSFGKQ